MPSTTDLTSLLSGNPKLLAVAGIVAFVLWVTKLLAEASETVSKFVPVLGKYWHRRGRRAVEAVAETRRSFSQRIDDVESDRDHAYRRLGLVEQRERDQQVELDTIRDYLIYDSGWHYRYERRAASRGEELDDQDIHKSYPEFEAERLAARPAE